MPANYSYLALFLLAAIAFTFVMVLVPVAFRMVKIVPKKPNAVKNSTFECGLETIGKTWVQFNFRYTAYALIFLVLDVLVAFLYPFALDIRNLGIGGLIGVLVFVAIIFIGYIYAWKKKVLEWK